MPIDLLEQSCIHLSPELSPKFYAFTIDSNSNAIIMAISWILPTALWKLINASMLINGGISKSRSDFQEMTPDQPLCLLH